MGVILAYGEICQALALSNQTWVWHAALHKVRQTWVWHAALHKVRQTWVWHAALYKVRQTWVWHAALNKVRQLGCGTQPFTKCAEHDNVLQCSVG